MRTRNFKIQIDVAGVGYLNPLASDSGFALTRRA